MVKMLPAFQDKFTRANGYRGRDSELRLRYGPSHGAPSCCLQVCLTTDPDFGIDISTRAGNQELIKALRGPFEESRRDTCLRFLSAVVSKLKADMARAIPLVEDGCSECHNCQLPIGRGQPGGLVHVCFGDPSKSAVITAAYEYMVNHGLTKTDVQDEHDSHGLTDGGLRDMLGPNSTRRERRRAVPGASTKITPNSTGSQLR